LLQRCQYLNKDGEQDEATAIGEIGEFGGHTVLSK
jgi:hypothetical protein